jgi:hypothetical protein
VLESVRTYERFFYLTPLLAFVKWKKLPKPRYRMNFKEFLRITEELWASQGPALAVKPPRTSPYNHDYTDPYSQGPNNPAGGGAAAGAAAAPMPTAAPAGGGKGGGPAGPKMKKKMKK